MRAGSVAVLTRTYIADRHTTHANIQVENDDGPRALIPEFESACVKYPQSAQGPALIGLRLPWWNCTLCRAHARLL